MSEHVVRCSHPGCGHVVEAPLGGVHASELKRRHEEQTGHDVEVYQADEIEFQPASQL